MIFKVVEIHPLPDGQFSAELTDIESDSSFRIRVSLSPHATVMASAIVSIGPKAFQGRIFVLEERTNKPLQNWSPDDIVEEAFE